MNDQMNMNGIENITRGMDNCLTHPTNPACYLNRVDDMILSKMNQKKLFHPLVQIQLKKHHPTNRCAFESLDSPDLMTPLLCSS